MDKCSMCKKEGSSVCGRTTGTMSATLCNNCWYDFKESQ